MNLNPYTCELIRRQILEHTTELRKAQDVWAQKQKDADDHKQIVDQWKGRIQDLQASLEKRD